MGKGVALPPTSHARTPPGVGTLLRLAGQRHPPGPPRFAAEPTSPLQRL